MHVFKKKKIWSQDISNKNEDENFKCKSMRLLGVFEEHPGEQCGWSEHGVRVVGGGKRG